MARLVVIFDISSLTICSAMFMLLLEHRTHTHNYVSVSKYRAFIERITWDTPNALNMLIGREKVCLQWLSEGYWLRDLVGHLAVMNIVRPAPANAHSSFIPIFSHFCCAQLHYPIHPSILSLVICVVVQCWCVNDEKQIYMAYQWRVVVIEKYLVLHYLEDAALQ